MKLLSAKEVNDAARGELSRRDASANKTGYGKLLILAGSRGMAGAAYFSGLAALRCGIGMVRYLGPECNRGILQTLLPEAMYEAWDAGLLPYRPEAEGSCNSGGFGEREGSGGTSGSKRQAAMREALRCCLSWADCLIAGPGLGQGEDARMLMRLLLGDGEGADNGLLRHCADRMKLIVLDADALNLIAAEDLSFPDFPTGKEPFVAASTAGKGGPEDPYGAQEKTAPCVVITPHTGEMARLLGCSSANIRIDPAGTALSFSREHGVWTVLKDAETFLSDGTSVWKRDAGSPALAKAGSGDVLTGVIAGTAAVLHFDLSRAVPSAVYIHGKAGELYEKERGPHSLLARELADYAGYCLAGAHGSGERTRSHVFWRPVS